MVQVQRISFKNLEIILAAWADPRRRAEGKSDRERAKGGNLRPTRSPTFAGTEM